MDSLAHSLKPIFENARFAKSVQGLLLLGLAWLIGGWIAQGVYQISAPELPALETGKTQAVSAQGQTSYLFGTAQPSKSPAIEQTIDVESVKKSRLNLSLIGVIELPNQGVAFIEQGGKTLVVSEGETIQKGVLLQDVLADQVIVLNQGVAERLVLKHSENDLLGKASSQKGSGKVSSSETKRLEEIAQQLKKSPMTISRYLRFQPINQAGVWAGVKIWSKTDKALFQALGFQEGDFVTRVNGKSINEMAQNPGLWQQFLLGSEFDLTILRNGSEETVSVNFDK